jgi:hypothetical protein
MHPSLCVLDVIPYSAALTFPWSVGSTGFRRGLSIEYVEWIRNFGDIGKTRKSEM